MARLLITTSGCNVVERKLRAVSRLAADFSPAWDDVKEPLTRGIENAFDKEGPGWAALSPETTRSKRGGGGILTRTKRLRNSLTNNPKTRETGKSIQIVTDVEYAEVSFGGRAANASGSGFQPARPLEISEHYKRLASTAISQRLVEEYERS